MGKRTPGEWRANQTAKRYHTIDVVSADGRVRGRIARTEIGAKSKKELLANALILAAAPDLLEALESLDLSFDRVQPPDIQAKIDAAIAKAKGGA